MSAETLTALNNAADAYNSKVQQIENRVAAALATIPSQSKNYTVTKGSGNDTGAGTLAEPLNSLQEAFDRTPAGGICNITLNADYHFSEVEVPKGIFVNLKGSAQPKLTFGWTFDTNDPSKLYRMSSFSPMNGAQFFFSGIDIELPADPAETFLYNHMKAVITSATSQMAAQTTAKFLNCNFTHNAGAHATLFGANQSYIVHRSANCTYQADYAGKVLNGYGGSGIVPATLSHLINTDLTFI